MSSNAGKVILVNGASSAGKSTLAQALQLALPVPFWHISIDHLIGANILPPRRNDGSEFEWSRMRPSFFDGFHRCLPALADTGNNLIVEHIIETDEWRESLRQLLNHLDVFVVGLHCPLNELERRELERGDRQMGSAKTDFLTIHQLCTYDLELSSIDPLESNVKLVIESWNKRSQRSAWFQRSRTRNPN